MSFGQELKDFASGFKIGSDIVSDSNDRRDRKEAREDAAAERKSEREYSHGRDAINDSRYSSALERQIEADKKADSRYEYSKASQERRWGIQDESAVQERVDRRKAFEQTERRLNAAEGKTIYPEGQLEEDGSPVPQGTTSAPVEDTPGPQSSLEDNYTQNYPWLKYKNQGAIRSMPLAPKLVSALDGPARETGVEVEVFSGGQPSTGTNRTGSHRHDNGMAGDIFLSKNGKRLSWDNPEDRPTFEKFAQLAEKSGLTGFGAGKGYMQPGSMHVGYGPKGAWGAGGHGRNAADWLTASLGYSNGGMVKGFSLGGAIDDGQEQYEPTPISIAQLMGGQQQEEQPQPEQVAEAIPTNVPTPTPRPQYDGAITSEGNTPAPEEEKPTNDPYEQGRRSVRDGLKRAMQDAGMNDNGAIDDPQSDEAHKKYLTGYGAAPRTLVQQALQAVDPDKKMAPAERNMAAFGKVYKHYMDAGEPEKAQKAAASMVQYYRQESNRFLSLAQAAAQNGNLDAAAKAAVAAYTNIPNGRDLSITPKDGGYEIKVTNEDGKVINTKVVNPQEFAAAAIGFNPSTFDDEILNAAGAPADKFDELSPENRKGVDSSIIELTGNVTDPNLQGNMLASVKNIASNIAGLKQNDMGAEPAFKLATAIAANPKDMKVKEIRGNPDRVRVTVDGQTVVVSKNALADLQKTNQVAAADKAKTDEADAKYAARNKAVVDLGKKAYEQFAGAVSDNVDQDTRTAEDFNPATADTPAAARRRTVADIGTQPAPTAIPDDPAAAIANSNANQQADRARADSLNAFGDPNAPVAIPDGGPQQSFRGQLEKGNIDLNNRPKHANKDGSVSTVRSITITDDQGHATVIPTISPDGMLLSDDAAIQLYQQTGQHLGKFENEKDAEAYAQALHQSQARRYAPN